jgi:hypothetical protein
MKKKKFDEMLKFHPCLDPKCNQVSYPLEFIMLNFGNQQFLVDFPYHVFNDIFETSTINEEKITYFIYYLYEQKIPHTSRFTLEVERHFFCEGIFHSHNKSCYFTIITTCIYNAHLMF